MKTHGGMTGKWLIWMLAVGWILGVCGGSQASADIIPCESLLDCPADIDPPTSPVDPGPEVELVIHFEKTVFDVGELIEGLFEVTNNSLKAITVDTYSPYDTEVRLKDVDGNLVTKWPRPYIDIFGSRTTTIESGVTLSMSFSWDQFEILQSPLPRVEPIQYIFVGYTPFTTRNAEATITIVPEPTSGMFVILALCGAISARK